MNLIIVSHTLFLEVKILNLDDSIKDFNLDTGQLKIINTALTVSIQRILQEEKSINVGKRKKSKENFMTTGISN